MKSRGSGYLQYQFGKNGKKYVQDFKPDLIHVHNLFFVASPAVLFAAHKLHIPVIITLHNYRLICANALLLRENQVCELCVSQKSL
ncbi:glycosyltransferase [Paraflavitalea speifideaquila]|uniref:glycosyltransferase n=1 Tax=Paraflavitalea speifideaquila TaxID=3076558 RepID=UPI003312FEB0